MVQVAPFGSWNSPISAERVLQGATRVEACRVSGAGVWWSEFRPQQDARSQILRRGRVGSAVEVLPAPFSAKTRIHEYGGGAWWCDGDTLYFSNSADQRLYRLDPDSSPVALTPPSRTPDGLRYGDGVVTPDHQWVIAVMEAHPGEQWCPPEATEPANLLVAVPTSGGDPVPIRNLADFVMAPRLNRDGELLAWIEWSHPSMSWDSSELWVARLDCSGEVPQLAGAHCIAGGPGESVLEPRWDPEDRLWFCSDRTDWWNLYCFELPGIPSGTPRAMSPAPHDVALPAWGLGGSRYGFLADNRVVFAYSSDGLDHLGMCDVTTGRVEHLPVPCTDISMVATSSASVVMIGASFRSEAAILAAAVGQRGLSGDLTAISGPGSPAASASASASASAPAPAPASASEGLSSASISEGQPITFPVNGAIAHGLYYPPTNPEYRGPDGERPPLIVTIHGGPTGAATASLNLRTQFWTSRGFALVDVNYRGSTGFGRRYRDSLRGQWGISDVADCIASAQFLADSGHADPKRLIIRGGSAGGFTALAALAFSDVFSAGASLYGVADLALLASDTHKFESRYLDGLVGPYPQEAQKYRDRSPLYHLEGFRSPVILFQGGVDRVVPPSQAEAMVAALREASVPVAYQYFPDEGHGFRSPATIMGCMEAELSFYSQVFGFPHPEGIPRVMVENLPG